MPEMVPGELLAVGGFSSDEEVDGRFSAVVPGHKSEEPRASAQRHGVMGLLVGNTPVMQGSTGQRRHQLTRVTPLPEDSGFEFGDFSTNGDSRKACRVRDPLATANIHCITTVSRRGRTERECRRPLGT
uniref:Uncharacterized protein n=1 Tax=Pyrodinium bahamense TaxID=73915 RepID=A0A7S0A1Y2_9DINO